MLAVSTSEYYDEAAYTLNIHYKTIWRSELTITLVMPSILEYHDGEHEVMSIEIFAVGDFPNNDPTDLHVLQDKLHQSRPKENTDISSLPQEIFINRFD